METIRYTKEMFMESCIRITDEDMHHWFYLQNDGRYKVVRLKGKGEEESISDEGVVLSESVILASDVGDDFEKFRCRPEYCVGRCSDYFSGEFDSFSRDQKIELYDKIFVGASLIRARESGNADVDSLIDRVYKNLEWLHSTDFFDGPASAIYHESYRGGLLDHTLKVVFNICDMFKLKKFKTVSIQSAVLVGLMHDWCKIGNYEMYLKNVKQPKGQWVQEEAYKRVGEPNPLGHGVLSMFYASRLFRLSVEESAALRWHMGAWRVCDDEKNELQSSNERYPLVHMIQFADQLSITNY